MKRMIVIGCPGSGKTTFAKILHDKTNIPLYHLDSIWHKADRTHISREEFDRRLGDILLCESFIIDGNYSRTMQRRLASSDTVFLFDLPREVCLEGVKARIGTARCDMPWVDTCLDPHLADEVERFAEERLPEIYALLDKYREGRDIVIFKSREEAEQYLEGIDCGGK